MMIKEMVNEIRVFDPTIELNDNAMLKVRPDLFNEWDFKKNDELGLDAYKITKGSNKNVWWTCLKCDSNYDMKVDSRTGKDKSNCPYCAGYRANHTNSLSSLNPALTNEWHFTKNGDLTPNDVTCNSGKKVWWLCEKGHEWEATVDRRNYGTGCPYCSGNKVWIGFNDMWTTDPDIATLLADPEDGYRYMRKSSKKVNWKCHNCKLIIKNKTIAAINVGGLFCSNCSDGLSYPERFVCHLLKQLQVEFEYDISFTWSRKKRYDFYLNDINMIIETHGIQHYKLGFEALGGRSLKEEQENDINKYEIATINGVEHYLVIDTSKSDFEIIKKNVMNSKLREFFDLDKVNWNEINKNSLKSFNTEILHLWNNENLSVSDICKKTKLHRATISKILNNYDSLGLCNYDVYRGRKQSGIKKTQTIYQLTKEFKIIKVWLGAMSIKEQLNIPTMCVYDCCNGKQKSAGGFIWKYEKDLIGWSSPIVTSNK